MRVRDSVYICTCVHTCVQMDGRSFRKREGGHRRDDLLYVLFSSGNEDDPEGIILQGSSIK